MSQPTHQHVKGKNGFFPLFNGPLLVFLLLIVACSFPAAGQQLSVALDRAKILIGEQVTLQIKVDHVKDGAVIINPVFAFSDSMPTIIVVKKSAIDTIEANGSITYTQQKTLTSFDSGKWAISPVYMDIQDKITGKKSKLKSTALSVDVLPVDVSTMVDYHPMKEIIDVEVATDWWLITGIAISVVILLLLLYLIFKRKKAGPPVKKAVLKGTPLERALKELQHLQEEYLTDANQIKKFHSTIDTTCRTYLQESIGINALHITASDIILRTAVYLQDDGLKLQFAELIRLNTAVKFAKFLPDTAQSKETLQGAIVTLQQLDTIIQQSRNNAQ